MVGDEMMTQHHQLSGHELEQISEDGEGQGSLVCCSLWGHRVGYNLETEQQQQREVSFLCHFSSRKPHT